MSDRAHIEVRAVTGDAVMFRGLVLGYVFRDGGEPVFWRWIARGAWGGASTREAALLRLTEHVGHRRERQQP